MKSVTLLATLILGLCASAQAALYDTGFMNGGVIPDGSLSGWSDTHTINDLTSGQITGVQVSLNLQGGFNGDLYAYLSYHSADNSTMVLIPLLTRVGIDGANTFGASGGMQITLADGNLNIGSLATDPNTIGTYAPDGRTLNTTTLLPGAMSDTSSFASLTGLSQNGDWTLFFADVSGGGGQSKVVSWSLDIITAVPEPINVALGVFGGLFLVGTLCRSERMKRLFGKPAAVEVE